MATEFTELEARDILELLGDPRLHQRIVGAIGQPVTNLTVQEGPPAKLVVTLGLDTGKILPRSIDVWRRVDENQPGEEMEWELIRIQLAHAE